MWHIVCPYGVNNNMLFILQKYLKSRVKVRDASNFSTSLTVWIVSKVTACDKSFFIAGMILQTKLRKIVILCGI